MPEFEVEFDVYCSCGNGLCFQSTVLKPRRVHVPCLEVEPCKLCIRAAIEQVNKEWRDEARGR